jgi:hypothetical protein
VSVAFEQEQNELDSHFWEIVEKHSQPAVATLQVVQSEAIEGFVRKEPCSPLFR